MMTSLFPIQVDAKELGMIMSQCIFFLLVKGRRRTKNPIFRITNEALAFFSNQQHGRSYGYCTLDRHCLDMVCCEAHFYHTPAAAAEKMFLLILLLLVLACCSY